MLAGFLLGQIALNCVETLGVMFEGLGSWFVGHGWALGALTFVAGWIAKKKGEFLIGVGAGLLGRWFLGVV